MVLKSSMAFVTAGETTSSWASVKSNIRSTWCIAILSACRTPMTRALQAGSGHIISFVALFGMINSIGGLAGTALLGTYQVIREKANSAGLVQGIDVTDPIVAQRLQAGGAAVSRVVGDPALESTQLGPMASQSQRAVVEDFLSDARKRGTTVACGGNRPSGKGCTLMMRPMHRVE